MRTPARRAASASRTVPDDVDRGVELRVVDRATDAICAARWKTPRAGVGEQADQIGVDDVGLDELEPVVTLGARSMLALRPELRSSTPDDGVPVGQQAVDQRRSDESGCAGDQCPHRATIPTAVQSSAMQSGLAWRACHRSLRVAVGADRAAAGGAGGAGVRRLLLLGRPDPGRPGRHAGAAVAVVPVRRPRRPRDARRRSWSPACITRLAPLVWIVARGQPGGAAAAGLAGAAAGAARDPRLASGAAGAVDLRVVHPAGRARRSRGGRPR